MWCARAQRDAISSGRPRVEADLERGGPAHHRPPGGTADVEVRLHRAVPRCVDDPSTGTHRIEAESHGDEAGPFEGRSEGGGVDLREAEHLGKRAGGRAQLELATGLVGDHSAAGQRLRNGHGILEPGQRNRLRGRPARGEDEPLQLHAHAMRARGTERSGGDEVARRVETQGSRGRRHGLTDGRIARRPSPGCVPATTRRTSCDATSASRPPSDRIGHSDQVSPRSGGSGRPGTSRTR